MIISKISSMNPNNSPKRKMTRFSEHPQIFQYSSKNKKQSGDLDDSLLLDDNYDNDMDTVSHNHSQKNNQQTNSINFEQKNFELEQLTSQLAEIQEYLNNQDEPIINPHQNFTPIKNPQPNRISFGHDNRSRLSFNFKNQLKSGRETMNIEEQTKLKSQLKTIGQSYQKQKQQQKQKQKSKNAQKEEDQQKINEMTIEQKIRDQIEKKKRITMDANSLINMINSYDREQSERKYRESRQNRITLDVFTLSKMVENIGLQNQEQIIAEQVQNQNLVTPAKHCRQNSFQKPAIFSAYKHNATQTQTHLEITKYLEQVEQRVDLKNQQNKKLQQQLNFLLSQLAKSQIRVSNTENNIEKTKKNLAQKQEYRQKMKKCLNQSKYQMDLQAIYKLEAKYGIQIIKYEKRQIEEDDIYCQIGIAHINICGFYAKLKSKVYQSLKPNLPIPSNTIDLKLMNSRELKECTQTFLFSLDDITRICKKYHYKYISTGSTKINLLKVGLHLKKIIQNLIMLDTDLQYLSLNFESQTFQINPGKDMLNFCINWAVHFNVLFQINLLTYLQNVYDLESVRVYDLKNHNYLVLNVNVLELQQRKQSLLFAILRQLICKYC